MADSESPLVPPTECPEGVKHDQLVPLPQEQGHAREVPAHGRGTATEKISLERCLSN